MQRITEWTLATFSTATSFLGAVIFWQSQIVDRSFRPSPDTSSSFSFWPMPAFPLLEMALFGFAGILVVAMNSERHSPCWGIATWAVCGALAGLVAQMILGAWSIGSMLLVAVAMLALAGAATLADRRRNRKMLPNLSVFILSAVGNFVFVFILIVVTR